MISNKVNTFYILPSVEIEIIKNPLSEAAKKTFDSEWDYYTVLRISWLIFSKSFFDLFKIRFYICKK